MTKSILCLALVLISLISKAQSSDELFINAAVEKLQHAKAYTLEVAALMPQTAYSFKPTPEEMSFTAQLTHSANNIGWLCSSYLNGGQNPVTKEDNSLTNKDSITTLITTAYDFAIATLQQFDAKTLADSVKFFAGPINKLQIINLLNDHQTHHRAQMLVYLRLNGIKPPAYVGW